MPAPKPSRNEQITTIFASQQPKLLARVTRRVNTDAGAVEDACGFAWAQLVSRPDIELDDPARVLSWLTVTAIREAIHGDQRRRRDDEISDTLQSQLTAIESTEAAVMGRARLRALRQLPERQRILVLLQALGYTYDELAQATGHTKRTVDRHLQRAMRNLETHDPNRT